MLSEAEINRRKLISERTKEVLARLKAEGRTLGRPVGAKSKRKKLTGKKSFIAKLRSEGLSFRKMAKRLNVSTRTLCTFVKENNL